MDNIFKFEPLSKDIRDTLLTKELFGPGGVSVSPGVYHCEIVGCHPDETRQGHPLLRLKLQPNTFEFYGYLTLSITEDPISHYYLHRFLQSLDMSYPEDGELDCMDFLGKTGFVKFDWQKDWRTEDQEFKKRYLMAKHFVLSKQIYMQ